MREKQIKSVKATHWLYYLKQKKTTKHAGLENAE